jgi:hypothetical protein
LADGNPSDLGGQDVATLEICRKCPFDLRSIGCEELQFGAEADAARCSVNCGSVVAYTKMP